MERTSVSVRERAKALGQLGEKLKAEWWGSGVKPPCAQMADSRRGGDRIAGLWATGEACRGEDLVNEMKKRICLLLDVLDSF